MKVCWNKGPFSPCAEDHAGAKHYRVLLDCGSAALHFSHLFISPPSCKTALVNMISCERFETRWSLPARSDFRRCALIWASCSMISLEIALLLFLCSLWMLRWASSKGNLYLEPIVRTIKRSSLNVPLHWLQLRESSWYELHGRCIPRQRWSCFRMQVRQTDCFQGRNTCLGWAICCSS